MKSPKSETPIEDIYEEQIRKASNKVTNLRKKIRKAKTPEREVFIRNEVAKFRALLREAKIKLAAYKKLEEKKRKATTALIEQKNKQSKLSSIRAQEVQGGLPSLGKKR